MTGPTKKACISCQEADTSFPRISANCQGKHDNDVCKLCWTRYINTKFMANPSGGTRCVQCPAQVTYDDIKRIIGRKDIVHYEFLVRRAQAEAEGLRECLADVTDAAMHKVTCHNFQRHDEEKDGRVLICEKCGTRVCVRCNVHEHKGETCEVFQARLQTKHGNEEVSTVKAFDTGYMGKETTKSGNETDKFKHPKPCPACGIMIEREDKCPHISCVKCGNQFCIRCNAPYYGENSVPELGNKAHQPDCVYYKREKEDRRFKRKVKEFKGEEDKAEVKEEGGGMKKAKRDSNGKKAGMAKLVTGINGLSAPAAWAGFYTPT